MHTRQFDLAAGGPTWISGPAISLALEAPVQCANVAWQDADCLAVVLALDNGSNGEVALLSVQGDPTAGTPAVHAISSMPMGDKQKLQGVCFHPTSRGGTFAVVMADGADTEYLQVATYTSVDPHTGAAVDLQSAGSVHLSTRTATDWRGAYVGDGSCLVVAVQGEQGWAVNVLHPHSVGVQHAVPVGGAVAAMAASPNGTLLAVAMQGAVLLQMLKKIMTFVKMERASVVLVCCGVRFNCLHHTYTVCPHHDTATCQGPCTCTPWGGPRTPP